ncbi:hypothetical protein [Clostridium ganghwense]|uniref:Bacteriocin immunity protein n=1 Tax=Clostridium ganghwense TaxID=312089 RepID=A0ABT4CVI4_9CLOT|nr:hypothetical protein [Clostridium ganghwense]MCY6372221.1 hypothetical protein [Clostridium ganghwense]
MKISERSLEIITVIFAYIVSRGIFKLTDFNYSIFSEPFNIIKFTIDFGTWMIISLVILLILKKCFKITK